MASDADRVPPADDTAVVVPEEQPTQAEGEWPVSDLYLVEPAEGTSAEPVSGAPTGPQGAETEEDAAPTGAPTYVRRRFPPDVGPGLLLGIVATVGAFILVALLLGLRAEEPATARTPTTTGTSKSKSSPSEQSPTTPAPASSSVALRDLTGIPVGDARSVLEKQGLRVQVKRVQSDRPPDEVLSQQPLAGTNVATGELVSLVVSSGEPAASASTVRVPGVVGLSASDATRAIRDAGLQPRIRPVTSSQPVGTVVDQSPAKNESLAPDSDVRLDVAKAHATPVRVDVPDVVGSTASAARRELRSAGFVVTEVSVESQEPAGTVVSQSPRAGAALRKGSEVTLRVSSGPAQMDVPDVTGSDEASARSQLENAGFQVRVTDESTTDPSQDGKVVRQSPQGGSAAAKGALVTITVARLV